MPRFLKLPSGLALNLGLIRRSMVDERGLLTVYFSETDTVILSEADSKAFRSEIGGTLSSNAKTAIFWATIILAAALVFLAVHRS